MDEFWGGKLMGFGEFWLLFGWFLEECWVDRMFFEKKKKLFENTFYYNAVMRSVSDMVMIGI